jgi:N-acetylmuramoyl-L-alanine amidase
MRSSARRLRAVALFGLLGLHGSVSLAEPQTRTAGPAVVTAVRRESLPDAVRIVIQLDREVIFRDQRLDGPPRVFIDLTNATPVAALKDQAFAFGSDVVRHVRVGRPSPGVTRVVLDLDGAAGYSVYPLYHPFRLVVDFERATPGASPAPALSASTTPSVPSGAGVSTPRGPSVSAPAISAPRATALRPTASTASTAPVTRPVPRPIPVPPSPIPSRTAAVPRALTRGAISPDPTPGASWLPDPLPARLIAAATASAVAVSTGSRSAGKTASGPVATIVAAGGGARPTPSAPAPPPTAPAANTAGGYSLSRQLGLGVSRVVIDPGHGGHDPGARVKGLNEADLVLDVALRLEKLLKAQRGVEVVLTRRSNAYIPLEERTALANRESADLFLSIHANASENPKARGLETYYLNFAPNPEAERIAARENAGSARTMHALPDIVKAIALNNKIDESRDFAGQVQASMVDRLKRSNTNTRDLGVKQAPFMVLIGATMPSVLAEISFITNDDESRLLKTTDYRQHIAEALLQGIQRYQRGLKSSERLAAQ